LIILTKSKTTEIMKLKEQLENQKILINTQMENLKNLKEKINSITCQTEIEILVLDDVVEKLKDGRELFIGNFKYIKYKGDSKIENNTLIEEIINQNISYKKSMSTINDKLKEIHEKEQKLKLEYKIQLQNFVEETEKITINQKLLKEFIGYYLYKKK